jgi:hypothetical protein
MWSSQALAEQSEDARHPNHEGLSVVAHELKRLATEFETILQPGQDRGCLGSGEDSQSDNESGMVVNDGHEPGLDEAPASQVDEERALDIDVPEFVGATSLVAGSGPGRDAATSATLGAHEAVNVSVADLVDLAPTHFSGDPLRVPICEEADSKDDRLDPSRDGGSDPMRASGIGNQTDNSICHEGGLPR